MKLTISSKREGHPSRGVVEHTPDWEFLIREYGFGLVGHAAGENYGKTVRTNAAFDDFGTGLVPISWRGSKPSGFIPIRIPGYNVTKFGGSDPLKSARDYGALIFYVDERTNRLPKYWLYDEKYEWIGFFEPNNCDIYLHDFTHDAPTNRTKNQIKLLMDTLADEFGFVKENKTVPKEKKTKIPVKWGMDPEFLFFSPIKDRCISANQVLSGISSKYVASGQIGWDGHNFTGELRPRPADTPEGLIDNLRELFKELEFIADESNLTVTCGGGRGLNPSEPLGGHLHISKVAPNIGLSRALDVFIGEPLKKMTGGKRPNDAGYGSESDTQTQDYSGNDFGFEYRTPPSFITFPSVVLGAFKIFQILVERGQDGDDIPESFSRKNVLALARNKHEERVLKRYLAFLRYGDLNSDPIYNWTVKESLLTSKLIVKDRTNTFNVDQLKRAVVLKNRHKVKRISGRKTFIISSRASSGNSNYIPLGSKEEIVNIISARL